MALVFDTKNIILTSTAVAVAYSSEAGCRGYTIGLLDIAATGVGGSVSFEARGVTNWRNINGTFLDGTTASSSFAIPASKLIRFNLAGCDGFRINIASTSGATINADVMLMAGGTALTT